VLCFLLLITSRSHTVQDLLHSRIIISVVPEINEIVICHEQDRNTIKMRMMHSMRNILRFLAVISTLSSFVVSFQQFIRPPISQQFSWKSRILYATTVPEELSTAAATTSDTSIRRINEKLSPFIQRIQTKLETMYSQSSSSIKCPFWRRRAADVIDHIATTLTFLAARHKSLDISHALLPGCQAIGKHVTMNSDGTVCKHRYLDVDTLLDIIRSDWCPTPTHKQQQQQQYERERNPSYKGYYITGKLNSTIYRDDCLFDGPDPDMPVRGLRKYLSAASHLFDHKVSYAILQSIQVDPTSKMKIIATWELGGVLMLPWRPKVQSWTGSTVYHLDEEGLVAIHEETWDISVYEAFVSTMWPRLGEFIWKNSKERKEESQPTLL